MAKEKSALEERLETGLTGTPQLKAAERRHYLGTFRERCCLTISVAELSPAWLAAFEKELTAGGDRQVFLNGNLADSQISPYMKVAASHQVNFTLKTGSDFPTGEGDLAVVVAARVAVHQEVIDVAKKYPPTPEGPGEAAKNPGLLGRLFSHRKGE